MSRTARLMGKLGLVGVFLACGASELLAQAGGPFQFNSLTPCRILDTRCPGDAAACAVPSAAPKPNPGPYKYQIQGKCGVPAGAKAATVNLTVVGPSHAGNLKIYPSNLSTPPGISTLNFVAGEPALANGAIVPLAGTTPDLSVYLDMAVVAPGGSTHFIVDVTGYFN